MNFKNTRLVFGLTCTIFLCGCGGTALISALASIAANAFIQDQKIKIFANITGSISDAVTALIRKKSDNTIIDTVTLSKGADGQYTAIVPTDPNIAANNYVVEVTTQDSQGNPVTDTVVPTQAAN